MAKRSEPVSLIGLPYLMGTRALNDGYHMAHGPRVLLSQDQVPALVEDVFKDVSVTMIEDADEPTEKNTGGDYRLLPIGDQMSRILVQNIGWPKRCRVHVRAGEPSLRWSAPVLHRWA
jgi:arginase